MLFTDGNFISAADLAVIDPEVTSMAATEKIVIDSTPGSTLMQTVTEMGTELTAKFQNFTGYLVGIGYTANHVAAVLNVLSTAINRPRARLNQVVAVDPDPSKRMFKQWATYYCLRAIYRAAFHRRLNDRYEKKMEMFEAERKRSWMNLNASGLPILTSPLACPGALLEVNAGTWGAANVTATGSGSGDPGTTYDVAITWVNGAMYVSPSLKNNAESGPSSIVTQVVASGQFVHIDITSLIPPNGTLAALGTADGIYNPMPASAWNVYIGATGKTLFLQNASPIPIATKTYQPAGAPVLSGNALTSGQFSEYSFAFQNMIHRA